MSTPQEQQKLTDKLLEDLEGTPTDEVGDATKKAERFTPEDEENHKRGIRNETRATIAKLKQLFLWVLFGIVAFLAIVLALGFTFFVGMYVWSFSGDTSKLGSFLGNVAVWILIALATLFIERIMPDKE